MLANVSAPSVAPLAEVLPSRDDTVSVASLRTGMGFTFSTPAADDIPLSGICSATVPDAMTPDSEQGALMTYRLSKRSRIPIRETE